MTSEKSRDEEKLFDCLSRSLQRDSEVCKEVKGEYYRKYTANPQYTKFYGGSITCRSLGCNLDCVYCFNSSKNKNPTNFGKFLSSREIFEKIQDVFKTKEAKIIRMTGTEAIMGDKSFNHLLQLIKLVLNNIDDCVFVIETNGIMLGLNNDYLDRLPVDKRLVIRVCLKGTDEKSFEKTTGVPGEYYKYQKIAIDEIKRRGFNCAVAIANIYEKKDIEDICGEVGRDVEVETIRYYNKTISENMKKFKANKDKQ